MTLLKLRHGLWKYRRLAVEGKKKTIFAAYMLKGEDNYWWETKRAMEETMIIPYARFTTLFLETYFAKYLQNHIEPKFLELQQRNMSITEYEYKFSDFSRFVPYHVDTDEKTVKHIDKRLKPEYRFE